MYSKHFRLEFGKPALLEILWNGGWLNVKGNISIKYDGDVLGSFQNRSDLEQGQEFQLKNGALLKIQLISNDFEILYNQQSIRKINAAINSRISLFIIGALFFAGSLWNLAQQSLPIIAVSYGGIGLGYIFCGFLASRNNSLNIWGPILLYFLYTLIFSLVIPLQTHKFPDIINIEIAAFLGIFLIISWLIGLRKSKA
jgi:hypothetical protein